MTRAIAIGVLVCLGGCAGAAFAPTERLSCSSNDECSGNQLCFPDGCGDPGVGLAVEISANARAGLLPQDRLIPNGTVTPTLDFAIEAPMTLQGAFVRNLTADGDPDNRAAYAESVTVLASGESELIPGLARTYQSTFTRPERGVWSLNVGAGRFNVMATAADTSIPPLLNTNVLVRPGASTAVGFAFPSADGTVTISGRLLKRIETSIGITEIAVTEAAMELQAFHPESHLALSQRVPVSSGSAGSKGDFVLSVAPIAKELDTVLLVATPKDPTALVPSKTFTLSKPYPATVRLEMGDFGEPLPQLTGEVFGTDNAPIANATVYVTGPVTGQGVFRSKAALSDAKGVFKLDVLPSATGLSYTLVAIPPPGSSAGVLQTQVKAIAQAGQMPVLSPARVTCPDRVTVVGRLFRPEGSPAAGVTVRATATEALKELTATPIPNQEAEAVTNEDGSFRLLLDPASYRFDLLPGADLPRVSRTVKVLRQISSDSGTTMVAAVNLGEISLSRGRKVTGTITAPSNAGMIGAMNATIRFFRVSTTEGRPSALLLGEAVADERGHYTVTLPTK